MNADLFENALMSILGGFKYFSLLLSEISEHIARSGNEKIFFNLLLVRLKQLSSFGVLAPDNLPDCFENLGDGLYSMHLQKKKFNIRIMYGFLSNGEPVLLLAFYERGDKGKTDYSSNFAPAKSRLVKMEEAYKNGTL